MSLTQDFTFQNFTNSKTAEFLSLLSVKGHQMICSNTHPINGLPLVHGERILDDRHTEALLNIFKTH